ncbi:MAG TPA: NotI family restriction endonuclease [Candidatus Competibacteraceae bacterium]|nr:NotI family restriction endonuclease [Candidatus Competibacteraceae bacterium]
MKLPQHPLAEVFGQLTTDFSERAVFYRQNKLCPFNNKVPNCTKDKAKNPLGVCSIFHNDSPVITCPIRFREDWLIVKDAAEFFFAEGATWSSLTEVRLNDAHGKSAGNIDVVLVAYDENEHIYDFGALEIQAVYISGNVREPFENYINSSINNQDMNWTNQPNYPRPDYLSSSRKRLAPQLLFKGRILNSWNKKVAVALNKGFYETLPISKLDAVSKNDGEIGWFIYELIYKPELKRFKLEKVDEVFTSFQSSLIKITTPQPGKIADFINILQQKLGDHLESAPDNQSIENPLV